MLNQYPRGPGVPIVISAPSGGGKTTLCHRVIQQLSHIEFSVSHTTRQPRPGEQNDVDYHFTSDAQFDAMIADKAFLEWAHVHGRRYGTGLHEANKRLKHGIDLLFDIDVQGGRQIADVLPQTLLVYVVPPSMDVLAQRLRQRVSDAPDEIERRLAVAEDEMRSAHFYTHWIINDQLDKAVEDLKAIIYAERLRQINKTELLQQLLASKATGL